jgi:hypothetical protein
VGLAPPNGGELGRTACRISGVDWPDIDAAVASPVVAPLEGTFALDRLHCEPADLEGAPAQPADRSACRNIALRRIRVTNSFEKEFLLSAEPNFLESGGISGRSIRNRSAFINAGSTHVAGQQPHILAWKVVFCSRTLKCRPYSRSPSFERGLRLISSARTFIRGGRRKSLGIVAVPRLRYSAGLVERCGGRRGYTLDDQVDRCRAHPLRGLACAPHCLLPMIDAVTVPDQHSAERLR